MERTTPETVKIRIATSGLPGVTEKSFSAPVAEDTPEAHEAAMKRVLGQSQSYIESARRKVGVPADAE
jgi:hypothetical protein